MKEGGISMNGGENTVDGGEILWTEGKYCEERGWNICE